MMRQANIPIEIKLLNIKEANNRARHYDFHKFERTHFFRKNFRRLESDIPKIRPKLPGLDVTFIPLFIQTVSFLLFSESVKNDRIERIFIYICAFYFVLKKYYLYVFIIIKIY